ncbi:MAG: VWA domain-containing protein [Thermoanaerobaculia bacterium]
MRAPVVPLLFLLFVFSPLFAQTEFQEELQVDLVLVDATVTDSRGNQILGLGKDDFIVEENGEPQQLLSVDYFTNRTLLTSREDRAAFPVERVRQERYFVLFFHELGDPSAIPGFTSELRRATQAARKWIDEDLQPQDKVAIAGFDIRLKVYADFTNDQEILRSALNDVVSFSRGLTAAPGYAEEPSIMRAIDIEKMVNETGRVYDGLELLADALRPIAARKIMPLFSYGIGDVRRGSSTLLENEESWYQPMIQALNSANVTVDSIFLLRNVTFYAPEQTLSRISSETGGDYYKNFTSFETPLGRIENAASGYYLLTYRIRKPEGAEGYQRIDVRLRNPEFRVKAREGYSY